MKQNFLRGQSTDEFTVDLDEVIHKSVSVAVLRVIAAYTGDELEELPPLSTAVAPEALDELVNTAVNDPDVLNTVVRFHYHGLRVTICSAGDVRVRSLEAE